MHLILILLALAGAPAQPAPAPSHIFHTGRIVTVDGVPHRRGDGDPGRAGRRGG